MKTIQHASRQFEFHFPECDTSILVQESERGVLIRATRNSFSPQRKAFFLRELEAEGFIFDDCKGSSDASAESRPLVIWGIDDTWLKPGPTQDARTNRFMVRLLAGGLLLWVGLLAALFTSGLK